MDDQLSRPLLFLMQQLSDAIFQTFSVYHIRRDLRALLKRDLKGCARRWLQLIKKYISKWNILKSVENPAFYSPLWLKHETQSKVEGLLNAEVKKKGRKRKTEFRPKHVTSIRVTILLKTVCNNKLEFPVCMLSTQNQRKNNAIIKSVKKLYNDGNIHKN